MSIFSGWRGRALFSDNKGPWGPAGGGSSGGGKGGDGGGEPPQGPWQPGPTPPRGGGGPKRPGNITSLDDWLKGNRARFGGGGGGGRGPSFPNMPSGSVIVWAIVGLVLLLLLFSTVHRVAPEERGVVTRFGRYVETLSPGIGLTLPAPIDRVEKVDVEDIRNIDVGSDETENLMLTGDENIIDIAYQVRWKIRDPENYLFELANQEDTVRQVAESAMRQVIANASLQDAIGEGRAEIQARVQEEMQQTLDAYRSGIEMRGVEIRRADPPEVVNEAFKQVTAAQQDAQSFINQARAYALQLTAQAQGEAEAFDKVYEEYRLAPEVTRQRLYYETMERVLRDVDKTIIEADGVQPYLPLNELRRSVAPATAGGGGQ